MARPVTVSFVATNEIKSWLGEQAAADDRSVSYVLRQILEKEQRRQAAQPQAQPKQGVNRQ